MWLVVLRSLAVYGGTAALLLVLVRRFVVRIRWAVALLLALGPLLFTGKALLTGAVLAPLDIAYQAEPLRSLRAEVGIQGTRNPLLLDVVSQMLPWRKAVREAIAQGRFPLWNPYVLAGEPLLAVQQPAVFHPSTWISLLLPLPQAWTFEMTIRMLLALVCAYAFFRGSSSSELAALLGAAAWAFSDFLLFFLGYPVTVSVAVFPLLLLGLSRLAEGGGLRAVGLTAAALCLIVVAGHPETLLFQVAGGGVFFLCELAAAPPGSRLRAVAGALLAGAIALGLTAVCLLPFLEVLPQTWQHAARLLFYARGERSESLLESVRRAVPSVVPYAWGTLGKSRVVERLILPAGYAGALLFPFACAGLASRSRRRGVYAGLALAGLALNARLAGLTDLVTSLPLFDIAIADYFVFLWVFGLAALAALGVDALRDGRGSALFAAGAFLAALAVVLVVAVRREGLAELGMSAAYLSSRILMQVVPLVAALLLVRTRRLSGAAPIALLIVLFVAERRLEEAGVYSAFSRRAFYPPLPVLDPIPRGEPVRFAALRYSFHPNIAAMYGLEDARGYEAMVFGPLAETFGLWCVPLPGFYNRVDGPSPFLALLNVRYILVPPGQAPPEKCRVVAENLGSRLCEIEALPRAFAPRYLAWTPNPRLQIWTIARIRDYGRDGVAGGVKPGGLGWHENGQADVRIVAYRGDRMSLSIDARAMAFIGTSIPGWRGWKLTIDGRRAPLLSFDRAFLGFEVPPGRHEATLTYVPDGFLAGGAISLATAAALAAALRERRRRPR